MSKTDFLEKTFEALQFLWGMVLITSILAFVFFDPTDWAIWKKPWLVANLTKECVDYRPSILDVKPSQEASHLAETIKDHPIDKKKVRQKIVRGYVIQSDFGESQPAEILWQILSLEEKERITKYYYELSAWNRIVDVLVPWDSSFRDPDWSQFEEGDQGLMPNNRYLKQLIEVARQNSESSDELKRALDRTARYLERIPEKKMRFVRKVNERIEDNKNKIAKARNELSEKADELEKANLATADWLSHSNEERRLKCESMATSTNQKIGLFDKVDTEINWENIAISLD